MVICQNRDSGKSRHWASGRYGNAKLAARVALSCGIDWRCCDDLTIVRYNILIDLLPYRFQQLVDYVKSTELTAHRECHHQTANACGELVYIN